MLKAIAMLHEKRRLQPPPLENASDEIARARKCERMGIGARERDVELRDKRVVDGTRVEQQTLRSQIRRSSLSRVLSRLSKRKLVKSTIDSRDRTSRLLFS